jgi:subtilase family serine protease
MSLSLVSLAGLLASQTASLPAAPTASIPDSTPVHLAIALRVAHPAELEDFRRAQQDRSSAEYQRFLTPQEFGRRFGPSTQAYHKVCGWLREAGFTVTEFPNRIFIESAGTAGQVTKLLGIRLQAVEGQPVSIHVPDGAYRVPPSLAPLILHVSGLDTRVRYRHHVARE